MMIPTTTRWLGTFLSLPLAGGAPCSAAEFALGFAGPAELQGLPGSTARGVVFAVLTQAGDGAGAEAWTVHVEAAGGRITAIGLEGTDAAFALDGGGSVWNWVEPQFGSIAFSKVELPPGGRRLPALSPPEGAEERTAAILRIEVEAAIPEGGGEMVVHYPIAATSLGEPIGNQVIQDGVLLEPATRTLVVSLVDTSCAEAAANVGFSIEPVASATPFDGILGGASGRGILRLGAPVDRERPAAFYVNIISQISGAPGIRAWSLSLLSEGGVYVSGASGIGPALEAQRRGGYRYEEVYDIPTGNVRFGIRAAAAFPPAPAAVVPILGTESVLEVEIEAHAYASAWISFRDKPWGYEGANALFGGAAQIVPACNLSTAQLTMALEPRDDLDFRRGDANGDGEFDIADAVWILIGLFRFGLPDDCLDAANANDDDRVDISDALFVLRHQFLGGPPPPAPFPACGPGRRGSLGCAGGQRGCP